ncbi:MAG: TIR domain-containing protein [Actinomycetota bacterium]|nr:TIR domain-containing protein [Actinomycetota bacterium]
MGGEKDYDVALSFAGEQRAYVDQVAAALRGKGVRPFYDKYERANLWGKDLYEHLDYVYQRAAGYCVVFASEDYANKTWTNHERKSAQARAIEENVEYILPARFDETEIPGIRKTIGYIDLRHTTPEELADLIVQKLGPSRREKFFPPVPDRLYKELGVAGSEGEEYANEVARQFFLALIRMSKEERRLLFEVFAEGCPSKLPDNVHISLDLLRRITGMPPAEVRDTLHRMSSLGIEIKAYSSGDHEADDMIEVTWDNRVAYHDKGQDDFNIERSLEVAKIVMLLSSEDGCRKCAHEALDNLDLSALTSALESRNIHGA